MNPALDAMALSKRFAVRVLQLYGKARDRQHRQLARLLRDCEAIQGCARDLEDAVCASAEEHAQRAVRRVVKAARE